MLANLPWSTEKIGRRYVDYFRAHPDSPPFIVSPRLGLLILEADTKADEFDWPRFAWDVLGKESDERISLRWWGWTQAHGSPGDRSLRWLLEQRPSLGSRATVYRRKDAALLQLQHALNNRLFVVLAEHRLARRSNRDRAPLQSIAPRPETVARINKQVGLPP